MGLYTVAGVLFILSFSFPIIMAIGGRLIGLHHSSIHTALAMFLPLFVLMPLIVGSIILQKQKRTIYLIILILCGITICWFANYFWETSYLQTSEFDKKRIWFFIHGFLFPAVIGAIASRKYIGFIEKFVLGLVIVTGFTSLLYVMSYDFNLNFIRLLGEMGLVAGIKASLGASACLSMLILQQNNKNTSSMLVSLGMVFVILLHCFAIIISGTRAAIFIFAASFMLFFTMSNRKKAIIFFLFIVIVIALFLSDFINYLVPQATINRLGMFYDQGIEIRVRLLRAITQIILENPLGKVTGYENSILGMPYSHNAIIQLIAEAGIPSIPALVSLFIIGLKNALAFRKVAHIRALIILSANVFMHSLSSGGAYNSLLWFLLFFFASLECKRNSLYSQEFGRIEYESRERYY